MHGSPGFFKCSVLLSASDPEASHTLFIVIFEYISAEWNVTEVGDSSCYMEEFTEDYFSALLSKEWLVKVDNPNSVPYLFKFGSSEEKNTYFLIITDTKTVWTEVLTRSQVFRRWRACNPSLLFQNGHENHFRLRSLLRDAHTPAGISDANFDIVESRDADLAFEIDFGEFKWRWETYLLGPKTSADVLSRHLILPLISLAHVSFNSADPVSELDEGDLEKVVDRVGRSARRSVDIHVKQTIARPRIATTLQRISSLFALSPALPSIRSDVEPPDLSRQLTVLQTDADVANQGSPHQSTSARAQPEATTIESSKTPLPVRRASIQPAIDEGSATESDDDDHSEEMPAPFPDTSLTSSTNRIHEPPPSRPVSRAQTSDSDSPPTKRLKKKPRDSGDSDSGSDSDSQAKGRSQGSRGTSTGAHVAGRGVRQPIKRGGKRF